MITVFRAYDEGKRLLYVGRTKNLAQRLKEIQSQSPCTWTDDMASLRITRYQSPWDAHAAVQEAIRTEDPLWNINGMQPERRPQWMIDQIVLQARLPRGGQARAQRMRDIIAAAEAEADGNTPGQSEC